MKSWLNLMALCAPFFLCCTTAFGQADPCPAQVPPDLARQVLFRALTQEERPPNEREQFISRAEGRPGGIAGLFCAEAVDLNRDGRHELLIGPSPGDAVSEFCGVAGDCPSWIYRRASKGYELIWEGVGSPTRLRTSTSGYRDIRTDVHATNAEREITIYKFDGRRYRARICMTETYVGSRRGREVVRHKRHRCEE